MFISDETVENIVNYIDKENAVRSTEISRGTQISLSIVRRVLLELEDLNILCRTGYKKGTLWWLA